MSSGGGARLRAAMICNDNVNQHQPLRSLIKATGVTPLSARAAITSAVIRCSAARNHNAVAESADPQSFQTFEKKKRNKNPNKQEKASESFPTLIFKAF